jgi:hypothetical protein
MMCSRSIVTVLNIMYSWCLLCTVRSINLERSFVETLIERNTVEFFPEGGVGLVHKRGCLLTLAYYEFPRWYEFGERRWNDILSGKTEELGEKPVPVPQIPQGLNRRANPGLCRERPATNDLCHGTAMLSVTQENNTDLDRKQKITENWVNSHTQNPTAPQHSFPIHRILASLCCLCTSAWVWLPRSVLFSWVTDSSSSR